jgi:predicted Zn-dependent protease
VTKAPATEEAARRAVAVGQKILAANPQLGTRTLVFTIGGPEPEVFHTGAGQVFVTEGLVRQCKTEGQLAAVLCHELGQIAAEHEGLVTTALKAPDRGAPDDGRAGNDYRPGFGGADGLRLGDLAEEDREKRRAGPPPNPDALARQYLKKAGYSDSDFDAAVPLLRTAESSDKFRQVITKSKADAKALLDKSERENEPRDNAK